MKSTIRYSGRVDISLFERDRLVSRSTFHNAGNVELFRFLAYCLVGDYHRAEQVGRPFKIRLYEDPEMRHPMTNLVSASEAPVIEEKVRDRTEDTEVTVKLHFYIPTLSFTDRQYFNISAAKLFPITAEPSTEDYCASVVLDSPVELPDDPTTEISLVIDWYLSIKN